MKKLKLYLAMAFPLLLWLLQAVSVYGQVIGLQPTPMAQWTWNPSTNQWNQVTTTETANPFANTPQPVVLTRYNAALGQWVPCQSAADCFGATSSTVNVNGNPITNPNFNSSVPSPDAGYTAITWKVQSSNVLAEVQTSAISSGVVQYNAANTLYLFAGDSLGIVDTDMNTVVAATAVSCDGTHCTITIPTSTFAVGQWVRFNNEFSSWSPSCLGWATAPILSTGFSSTQFEVLEAATNLPTYAGCTGTQTGTGGGVSSSTNAYPNQTANLPYFTQGGAIAPNFLNYHIPGDTITAMNTNYTARYHAVSPAVTGNPAWLIVEAGSNDLGADESAATMEAAYQGLESQAHTDGYKVALLTMPGGGSNYSCGIGCSSYTVYNTVQSWIRANQCLPGTSTTQCADYIVDIGNSTNATDGNFWQLSGTFVGHPTNAGASVFAARDEEAFTSKNGVNTQGAPNLGSNTYIGMQNVIVPTSTTVAVWGSSLSGSQFALARDLYLSIVEDYLTTDLNGLSQTAILKDRFLYGSSKNIAAEAFNETQAMFGFGGHVNQSCDACFSYDPTVTGQIDVGTHSIGDKSKGMAMQYIMGPATAPTGSCTAAGMWEFTADGNATYCPTGLTWTTFGGGGLTNPMTTLGDTIYGGTGGTPTRLAGNTTATQECLTETGTGSAANAPAWTSCPSGGSGASLSAQNTWTTAGAASAATQIFNGSLYTGGTGTTTEPFDLWQPSAATAVSTWSTAGTWLGINSASGFTGNFLDFHINGGASVFNVNSVGAVNGIILSSSANSVCINVASCPNNSSGAALAIQGASGNNSIFLGNASNANTGSVTHSVCIGGGLTCYNATISNSVEIGFQAGGNSNGCADCGFLGYEAGAASTNLTDAWALCYSCTAPASNTFTLGDSGIKQTYFTGTIHNAGTVPTASAGTLTGVNNGGYVSGLSAATSVTITFSNSGWSTWASCVANTSVSGNQPYVSSISTTAVTFTFSSSLTGTVYYHCDGS